MKRSTFVSLLMVSLALVTAGTGCKKKPVGVTNIPGRSGASMGSGDLGNSGTLNEFGSPGRGTELTPTESGLPTAQDPMNTGTKDSSILQAETIYFDLDSATVKESSKANLAKVAEYMKSHPDHDILIEGHCDERGTEGYNLSLGEKRAQATREVLASLGANANDIYTVSYGETHPADEGHDESAWSKNRRAQFIVALPAGQ